MQFGVVDGDDLRACGLSDDQVWRATKSGLLIREWRDAFRLASAPLTFESRAMAATRATRHGLVGLSHRAGARANGWRGARGYKRIELTVPITRRPRLDGVTIHRSAIFGPADIRVSRHGIPITRPERTVVDSAAGVDRAGAARILHGAVLEGHTTYDRIWLYLSRYYGPGIAGSAMVKRILLDRDHRDRPTQSDLEDDWIAALTAAGVAGLVTQVAVDTRDGGRYVDVGDPEAKVGIDFDSRLYHSSEDDYRQERRHRYLLTLAGWAILPVTEFDLEERVEEVAADFMAIVTTARKVG